MIKFLSRTLCIICLAMLCGISASFAQGLTGSSDVCANSTTSYTYSYYDDQYTYTRTTWTITGASNITGTGNSRTVKWLSSGTVTVNLYNVNTFVTSVSMDIMGRTAGVISNSISGGNSTFKVCPGSGFTLTNYDGLGSITWQKSPNGANSWTNISTTGAGGSIGHSVTQNTDFRILDQCGGTSPIVTAMVYVATTPGTVTHSGASTICSGSVPGTFMVSADAVGGNLSYQWQKRVGGGSWSNIPGATSPSYQSPALTQTTDFQRLVSGCVGASVYSNILTVTIDAPPVATLPLVSSPGYVCEGQSQSVTLSMTGQTGTVTAWYYKYSDNGGGTWSAPVATSATVNATSAGTNRRYAFYATVQNGVCPTQTSPEKTLESYTSNVGTITPALREVYGTTSVSGVLTLNNPKGTIQNWQYKDNGAWYDIDGSAGTQYSYFNLLTSTQYRAKLSNGCIYTTPAATVTIYSIPSIAVSAGTPALALGNTCTLSVNTTYYQYQWTKDNIDISGATNATYVVSQPGVYSVKVKGSATAAFSSNSNTISVTALSGQADAQANAVIYTTLRKSGVTPTTNLFTSLNTNEYQQTVNYYDGLGRTIQTIGVGQSPLGKDVVAARSYDANGLETKAYLPYVETGRDGLRKTKALQDNGVYTNGEQYKFYQNKTLTATSTMPYAQMVFEESPMGRMLEQGAPGTEWQPGVHAVKNEFRSSTAADNVKIWTVDGPSGTYAAGQLWMVKTIDENGNSVLTFTDKQGRLILKRVQIDATIEGVSTPWLETYSVYDKRGNLALQVPPKAAAKLTSGTAWSTNFRDEWCFIYNYDAYNRLVEKKVPDAAWEYYGYDPLGRLVLTQNGTLRAANKWMFRKYDAQGRVVMAGIYTNTTHTTRTSLQTTVLDGLYSIATDPYFEKRGTALHGYTNQSFPVANEPASSIEVLGVYYYDSYDFDYNGTADYGYTAQGIAGEGSQGNSYGLPTGSKSIVLGTTNWLIKYNFYDSRARLIQVRSNNHLSLVMDNLATVIYDFEGKVVRTKVYHNAGGSNQTTTLQRNVYDHANRLKDVYHQINSGAEQLVARYQYNELGQLIAKNLHKTGGGNYVTPDPLIGQPGVTYSNNIATSVYSGEAALIANTSIRLLPGFQVSSTFQAKIGYSAQDAAAYNLTQNETFAQTVDYRYNIRGWLTSINNAQLANDGITNSDNTDYFGMELSYNAVDAGLGNSAAYNGNISAIKWKGPGQSAGLADQRSYKYTYDKSDKLLTATFQANTGAAWTKEQNTLNENINYDHNGNIVSLQRNQNQRGLSGITITSTPQVMDNLSYTYSIGNQLNKVEDAVATSVGIGDFKNNATDNAELTYTVDGSLSKDSNKGISSITYNILGKAQLVTFTNGTTVAYTYDAGGNKLKMATTTGGTTTTTDYVGSHVYTNNNLSFFSSPEGRIVKNGSTYERQYAIADHQGNTRLVFTTAPQTPVAVTATMEDATNSNFTNYTNRTGFNLFDHTDAGTTYTYAQKLTGGYNSQVGVAKSYKVYAGDKVKIEAWAKYQNPTSTGSNVANFASALLQAFGAPTPVGGEVGTSSAALNTWGGLVATGSGPNASGPKAFVNIIVFDKNYKLIDAAWEAIDPVAHQVGASPVVAHDYLMREYTAKEEGYVFMYVSNENATLVDVYFDDVSMTHTKGNVVQYNEYYAYGLQTANSWTRENSTGNAYLYNGGSELNSTTGNYEMLFREYDPVLGRMNAIDPMAPKYAGLTPYNYAFNNPVYWNDPSGADPDLHREEAAQRKAAQRLGTVHVSNSMNSIYRGGSMTSSLTSGWSPLSGSLSLSSYMQADAYFQYRQDQSDSQSDQENIDGALSAYFKSYGIEFSKGAMFIVLTPDMANYNREQGGRIAIGLNSSVIAVDYRGNLVPSIGISGNNGGGPSFWDVFENPWLADGRPSDFFTMSGATGGLGVAAWVGETMLDFESVLASSASGRAKAFQGAKFMKNVAGPTLGLVGIGFSTLESMFDSDGYTWGDGAKTALGVCMVGGAFIPGVNVVVAGFALADVLVGTTTGFSLTDRLGTAVDYSLKNN